MSFKSIVYLIVALLVCISCISNKNTIYFSEPALNYVTPTPVGETTFDYHLQPRDILNVRIKTLDEASSNYFNIQPENSFQQVNAAGLYLNGYSISAEGNINLPEIGKISVNQLTIQEAEENIQKAVRRYLPNSTVIVKLVSFKISVLGEVNSPGYFYIYNEQVNLLEALALAGDMTNYGNRENITLFRKTDTGMKGILINLKDINALSSEYFQLLPNDIIYIQPLKQKNTRDNLSTFNLLSIVFGAISATVLLLNYAN